MRGFSDEKRRRIHQNLIETGREKFGQYGLQKTNINDLTEPVGIGTSTFYRFFDSKEELYLQIREEEQQEIMQSILADSFEATDDPEEAIKRFLHRLTEELETNPLLRTVIMEDELDRLIQYAEEEGREADRDRGFAMVRPYLQRLADRGELRSNDSEVIGVVFRAVTSIVCQMDVHDTDKYSEARDLLIEAVADGLVVNGNK